MNKSAITKIQAIIIAAILIAAIVGGMYYYYTTTKAPAGPVKIKVVAIAHAAPGIKALAEDFMDDYPDIDIEILEWDWETGRDRQLLDMATKAGGIDTYMWDCIYTGAFAPHCLPVDNLTATYPDSEIFTDYDDFIASIDGRYAHWDEKRIGYVVCTNVMAMFYREDLFNSTTQKANYATWISNGARKNEMTAIFDECGLNSSKMPLTLVVPTTLEELLPISMFFTTKFNPDSPTEVGNTIMAMRTHTIHWEYCWLFAQWRRSTAGKALLGSVTMPWGDLFNSTGYPAFDPSITDMGTKTLKLFERLTECQTDPMETEWSQCMEWFGSGDAAMWAGSWASCFIDFTVKAPEEYPAIAGRVGVAPSPGVGIDGTWQVGVSKYSAHPEEAWLFCQYMMSKDAMIKAWELSSSFPARISVIENLTDEYPVFDTFVGALEDPGVRNYVPQNPELEDAIARLGTQYIAGTITAETAIDLLAKDWKFILGIS